RRRRRRPRPRPSPRASRRRGGSRYRCADRSSGGWRGPCPMVMRRRAGDTSVMKIASWNVNSLNVRLQHLAQWLAEAQPDVVGLQETKLDDLRFPDAELASHGYRSVFAGQMTYNGVAILAREHAIEDVRDGIPGF